MIRLIFEPKFGFMGSGFDLSQNLERRASPPNSEARAIYDRSSPGLFRSA